MKLKRPGDLRAHEVEMLSSDGSAVRARIDGAEIEARVQQMPDGSAIVELNGSRVRIAGLRRRTSICVAAGPFTFDLVEVEERAHAIRGLATPELIAPMPGKVLKIAVREGQRVEAGEPLVVIEAMKVETTLTSESAAVVRKIRVAVGQSVDHGEVLIDLSPPENPSPSESETPAS